MLCSLFTKGLQAVHLDCIQLGLGCTEQRKQGQKMFYSMKKNPY